MAMVTLTCRRCGQWLAVSPMAPRWLSCPRCLGPVVNPHAPEAVATQRSSAMPPPLPRRVIPLDVEVGRDARGVDVLLVVLAILYAAAAVVSFQVQAVRGAGALLAVAAVALGVITIALARRPKSEATDVVATVTKAVAGSCLLSILLLGGLVLLLFGACALIMKAAGTH
jgi:hypothetical protein